MRSQNLSGLYQGILTGNAEQIEKNLMLLLGKSISFMDGQKKENFYHGFLLGVLSNLGEDYSKKSNRESGDGRYDICIYPIDQRNPAVIIELKISDSMKTLESLGEGYE